MTFQEKKSIVSLFASSVIYLIYYLRVMAIYNEKVMDTIQEMSFWAAAILIIIPILIVTQIVIYIISSIIQSATTKEEIPDFSDELDKLIELKSSRNSNYVFMAGFILAMGAMVLKMDVTVMLQTFLLSLMAAGLTTDISQIYFIRRGIR